MSKDDHLKYVCTPSTAPSDDYIEDMAHAVMMQAEGVAGFLRLDTCHLRDALLTVKLKDNSETTSPSTWRVGKRCL